MFFEGWKRGSDGTVFSAGTEVEITDNTLFSAQWKGNSYTIVFHPDQDSKESVTQQMTYGTAALLKQTRLSKQVLTLQACRTRTETHIPTDTHGRKRRNV